MICVRPMSWRMAEVDNKDAFTVSQFPYNSVYVAKVTKKGSYFMYLLFEECYYNFRLLESKSTMLFTLV